jgi:hypothetical protein
MIYWNYLISLNCKSAQRWITIFAFISVFSSSHAQEREFETICWTEGALIEAYKDAIYNPQAKADMEKYIDSLEMDSFQTKDGHTIRGLVWRASLPKGYLLIAQGTSMLAAEIYEQFKEFSDIGLDVYLYDYRGFGESNDIETTLEGMISDYSLRIRELNEVPIYKVHYILGISIGGVVFSNSIRDVHEEIDGVVFDSVPHKVPWYAFCPSKIDPIRLLPDSCENWLIIGAKKDSVIGRRASKLGRGATNSCGAQSKIEEHFGHVFMDTRENTIERITAAKHHFELLIESKINGQ